MLREPTMEKLQAMRLGAMAAAWLEQQRSADVIALSFDERFAMLVDAEWMARENKRLGRALKEAKLRIAEASAPRARQGERPAARDVHMGRAAPGRPRQRCDGDRQDLRGLRARPASVPQGLPRDVPARESLLR